MEQTNNSATRTTSKGKIANRVVAALIAAGIAAAAGLAFLFTRISEMRQSSSGPQVYSAEQTGATDTALLVSWSSSRDADQFIVRYREAGGGEFTEMVTDKPFAAIRGLNPGTSYEVQVLPGNGGDDAQPASVVCMTEGYASVRNLSVSGITSDSALLKWEPLGLNSGYRLAVYMLDPSGHRVGKTRFYSLPQDAQEYRVEGLLSEVNYTVCLMPVSRYTKAAKLTFTTGKYSNEYNRLNISRFVICSADSGESLYVRTDKSLLPGGEYQTSTLFTGIRGSDEKADFTYYITDGQGNLIALYSVADIPLCPQDAVTYRVSNSRFTAPSASGSYFIFCAIDGVTVRKNSFTVV